MLPPVPRIEDYGISEQYGFLPTELPLQLLPDTYYSPWEAIIGNLQALLLSRRLRGVVHKLPILSTSRLVHPAEWRRAYMVLAFIMHSYIWGDDIPAEVSFPQQIITTKTPKTSHSEFIPPSPSRYSRFAPTSSSRPSPHTPASAFGTSALYSPTNP